MRPPRVVMPHELPKGSLQVASAEDQDVVEALPASLCSPSPSKKDCMEPGGTHPGAWHLGFGRAFATMPWMMVTAPPTTATITTIIVIVEAALHRTPPVHVCTVARRADTRSFASLPGETL